MSNSAQPMPDATPITSNPTHPVPTQTQDGPTVSHPWTAERAAKNRERVLKKLPHPEILGVYKGQIVAPFLSDPQYFIDEFGLTPEYPNEPWFADHYISREKFPDFELIFHRHNDNYPVLSPGNVAGFSIYRPTTLHLDRATGKNIDPVPSRIPNIHFAGIRIGDTLEHVQEAWKAFGYKPEVEKSEDGGITSLRYQILYDDLDLLEITFSGAYIGVPGKVLEITSRLVESVMVNYVLVFDQTAFIPEAEQDVSGYEFYPETGRIAFPYDIYSPQVAPYL